MADASTLMDTPDAVYRTGINASQVLDYVELPFYYLGLNTPAKRFAAGAIMTGGVMLSIKPGAMFYEDGTPRPWSLTSKSAGAVLVPWWTCPVFVGLVFAVLV